MRRTQMRVDEPAEAYVKLQAPIILDKIKRKIVFPVARSVIETMEIDRIEHWLTDCIHVHMSHYVAGKEEKTEYTTKDAPVVIEDDIALPRTWWDHWKRDHAPRWFVDRFPVQYDYLVVRHEEQVTHHHHVYTTKICPHIEVPTDNFFSRHSHVVIQQGYLDERHTDWMTGKE